MANSFHRQKSIVGMIGGGQLGRMFIQEAVNYAVDVHILDGDINAPCKNICSNFTYGEITDYDAVYNFGKDKEIITVEIENINIEALEKLEQEGKKVFPQPVVLRTIRDKGIQKQFYAENTIPTAPFQLIENKKELEKQHFPIVQKLRTGGYDGKGVAVLHTQEDLQKAFDAPSVVEEKIPFEKEISVLVARSEKGEVKTYPAVECEFNSEANLVEFLFSPANITATIEQNAQQIATQIIAKLEMVGMLAVEFFLLSDGTLLVNEIAPRPHNSGHHTIECNYTSQFEQHLRAILNMPLGSTELIIPGVMINLLGANDYNGEPVYEGMDELLQEKGVHFHLYGKQNTKPFRKMGHLTVALEDLEKAKTVARKAMKTLSVRSI